MKEVRPMTSHPMRYPKHKDPEKGQVFDGECNVTACSNPHAQFWNMGTYGLYCASCADGINRRRDRPPLCIKVEEKPALDDMEQFKDQHGYMEIFR